jgi:lipoyl(octanoyl) transferase
MGVTRSLSVFSLGMHDYTLALALQDAVVAARIRDEIGDTLILLEHPQVYTLGRGADAGYIRREGVASEAVPIHRVSRGGQVTYHGPGQLVGYPIVKLDGVRRDVSRYLRKLERALIDALREFGIEGVRRPGMTGVWVPSGAKQPNESNYDTAISVRDGMMAADIADRNGGVTGVTSWRSGDVPARMASRKIGSIGVGIRRWVTMHGFALNVTTDLSYFDAIVPCGIEGCQMTSIVALGHPEVTVAEFAETIQRTFASVFEYDQVIAGNSDRLWTMLEPGGGEHVASR